MRPPTGSSRPGSAPNPRKHGLPGPLEHRPGPKGPILGSGTHAKVDGKTRGKPPNSTPKTTTSSEARKAECWFSQGNSHIGPSGGPPGPPSLIREFTMFWRTWTSETTCFTVRIKIASSGSLRAVPGGPRRLLETPRAPPLGPGRNRSGKTRHSALRGGPKARVSTSPERGMGPNARKNSQRSILRHAETTPPFQPPK